MPLLLLATLGVLLLLACNPLSGGGSDGTTDAQDALDVNFDRQSSGTGDADNQAAAGARPTGQPTPADPAQSQESPAGSTPAPPAGGNPASNASPPEQPSENPSGTVAAEEARDLVWAFLSQCVTLGDNKLQARRISGQWFIQAAGDDPDRFGIWTVNPGTGDIQPHNIRARQWEPRINSSCTRDSFAEFYHPTPSPDPTPSVTSAENAVTSVWGTLVKCYPGMSADNLRATLDPSRSEWIVTAHPEVTTNYGVWVVTQTGEVAPYNRQAQGIYDQLDSGLC